MTRTPTIDDFIIAIKHYGDYRKALAYENEVKYYYKHGKLPQDAKYVKLVKTPNGAMVCMPE